MDSSSMENKAGHLILADIEIIMCLEMGKDGSVNILAFIKHLSSSSSLRILLEPGHRKGQPFFTLQQLFIRYFKTAKVHKYVMKCAHFPWSQESNITEWRVCSGRPTSCVYLEAYSPLPPPVMVRRHTLGRDLGSGETTGH